MGGFIGAERAYDGPADAPPLYDKPLLRERETGAGIKERERGYIEDNG